MWTTAETVDEAMAEIGRNPADFQLSADRSRAIPLTGLRCHRGDAHTVSVADRRRRPTVTTAADTVGDLLAEQGITLGVRPGVARSQHAVDRRRDDLGRTLPKVQVYREGQAVSEVSDVKTVGDLLKANKSPSASTTR